MNSISKEDYERLLEQLSSDDQDLEQDIPEDAWIPSEPFAKDRMKLHKSLGSIDATDLKKDQIQDALYSCKNIQVGNFSIRIESYHGYPNKQGKGTDLSMDIYLMEKRYKTPSGNPCNMDYKIDIYKDNRFTNRPWLHHFVAYGRAVNIPVETVVDVVKWLQALKRLPAFL